VMLAGKRPHISPLDMTGPRLAEVRAALQAARVRCENIAAYTHFGPATATEVPFVEMQIGFVESLARLGAELGAHTVRLFTAYESDQHDIQVAWARVVTAVREICDRVAPLGTTIAI